ncbi:MAG: ComEC/Rec2 family competence protein, partial [Bacteroidales bacterium]|nr:ComEC/Rec2 family competence protein [Bacteroidales bacterium]
STLLEPAAPFSVGFMLSYSAMLGIRFILPLMLPLLKTRSRLLQGVWSIIAMSISCQIATAPLSYLFFGTFPRYFMVTNLTLMPLTSLVIYGAPITISLDFLLPEWDFPSIALSVAIKLMNSIVSLISTM